MEGVRPELEAALSAAPDDPARYTLSTRTLEQRIAVCDQLSGYLDRVGVLDRKGSPRAAVALLVKAWSALDSALRASALTPQSAAKLASTAASVESQLERLRERGAEVIERQSFVDVEVDDDGE